MLTGKLLTLRSITAGTATAGLLVAGALAAAPAAGAMALADPVAGPILNVSTPCPGQNAEVWQAVDRATGDIYEAWIGCNGIGFSRSTDGGKTFSAGRELPFSGGAWDPAVTVGPDGKVYVAFMKTTGTTTYPVVDISANHGGSFPVVSKLLPPKAGNWGDRDFIAIGPRNQIYVTWDYGPKNNIKFVCDPTGSCSFSAGDVNAVLQRSLDGGKTWSMIIPISPGYPASGADSAPIVVEPNGHLDVLYQGYQVLNKTTDKFGVAHEYFTSSINRGLTWSAPKRIGPVGLNMNQGEWWIDGSIGADSAGNLYATWDTQSGGVDLAWLAYSTNHGVTWSKLVPVTTDQDKAMHLVQVVGGAPGIAYVGLLTNSSPNGYAQYLRPFSIASGWLTTAPLLVSQTQFGNASVWPGDTFGLSVRPGGGPGSRRVSVSWGSGLGSSAANSQIWQSTVTGLP